MLLLSLLLIPLIGIFFISTNLTTVYNTSFTNKSETIKDTSETNTKTIALITSIINLFISLIIFMLFDFSFNQFQFVQEPHFVNGYSFYLGLDGISIYFVLLTTIITPIVLLSN